MAVLSTAIAKNVLTGGLVDYLILKAELKDANAVAEFKEPALSKLDLEVTIELNKGSVAMLKYISTDTAFINWQPNNEESGNGDRTNINWLSIIETY
jgi:hypothetical protein